MEVTYRSLWSISWKLPSLLLTHNRGRGYRHKIGETEADEGFGGSTPQPLARLTSYCIIVTVTHWPGQGSSTSQAPGTERGPKVSRDSKVTRAQLPPALAALRISRDRQPTHANGLRLVSCSICVVERTRTCQWDWHTTVRGHIDIRVCGEHNRLLASRN